MKIAFISEYFPPFAPGGAEWSTYYLAKNLVNNYKQEIFEFTPNYGSPEKENMEGIRIERYPFYLNLKKRSKLSEFDHLNPVWFLWSAWFIYKLCKKNNIDIIHVHGKYSIPGAKIANIFLQKKIVATIRDYQIICNYGFCIYNKEKSCNLWEFFTSDFLFYLNNYVEKKNIKSWSINLIYALYGRIATKILKSLAKDILIVTLSTKQKSIFLKNGFKYVEVVQNSIDFPSTISKTKPKNQIVFAGRLTPGKGVTKIIEFLPAFFEMYPQYRFIFAGEGMLKQKLLNLSLKVVLKGQLEHKKLMNLYQQSMLVLVPSLWHEPFGRTALESISVGTPAVVSDRGGLPEIVKNGLWGYICEPNPAQLLASVNKAIVNNLKLRRQIAKDFNLIKKQFGDDTTKKYIKIYRGLHK